MSYDNKEVERTYDVDAVRNGTLLVGNEGLVTSSSVERRYTSRGVDDNRPLIDRLVSSPVRDELGSRAAYAARGLYSRNR